MTAHRLIAFVAVIAVSISPTGGNPRCDTAGDAGDADGIDILPPPYMPDENLFQTRAEVLNNGCVVSVTDRVLVIQVIPNKYG